MAGLVGRVAGVLGLEPKSGDSHAEEGPSLQQLPGACQKGPLSPGTRPLGRGWPPWERQLCPGVVCSVPALQVRASPLGGGLG